MTVRTLSRRVAAEARSTAPAAEPARASRVLRGHERPRAPVVSHAGAARGGSPLPGPVRSVFERRLGVDLAAVRVHTDAATSRLAHALGARAFAVGRHIGFAAGRYAPHLGAGRRLLAHELAHVVQASRASAPTKLVSEEGDPAEREAKAVSEDVVEPRGEGATRVAAAPSALVSREELPGDRWRVARGDTLGEIHRLLVAAGHTFSRAQFFRAVRCNHPGIDINLLRTGRVLRFGPCTMRAPTRAQLRDSPIVRRALDAAWTDSQPADPANRHEEGGWIYMNTNTGEVTTRRAAAGAQASIDLNNPPAVADSVVVGNFHTHPNPTAEGWDPAPSGADTTNAAARGVPGLVRADDGIHTYGVNRRAALTGAAGYPGAPAAPQARKDGTYDDE